MSENTLVSVKNLRIHYCLHNSTVKAVNGVSFDIRKGETFGLVGETGAGKTTISLGILRLLPDPPARVIEGSIEFNGKNIFTATEAEMRDLRGDQISMIFQDPMTALNPIETVGDQILECVELHQKLSAAEAREKVYEILEMVGIHRERYEEYPHQFSGGMKQRIVIAMALVCRPELLIADEPTTALDVTIQAQVLDMIQKIKNELGTSMLLITHDLGIIAETCDRVAVVYAGQIVEMGTTEQIYENTLHPYTNGLFGAIPSLDTKSRRLVPIEGLMPDPANLPKGCYFSPRCSRCMEICRQQEPPLTDMGEGHMCRCFAVCGKGGTADA